MKRKRGHEERENEERMKREREGRCGMRGILAGQDVLEARALDSTHVLSTVAPRPRATEQSSPAAATCQWPVREATRESVTLTHSSLPPKHTPSSSSSRCLGLGVPRDNAAQRKPNEQLSMAALQNEGISGFLVSFSTGYLQIFSLLLSFCFLRLKS